jgi:diguanylate cyclase (GGDEF)-like protein
MSKNTRLPSMEQVPLASRIGWALAFRVLVVTAPLAMWLLLPNSRSSSWVALAGPAAVYLSLVLLSVPLVRLGRGVAVSVFLGSLLADGAYLIWAFHALQGLDGPVVYLVVLHVVAVTLLASFRTGLRLAMWHSLLTLTVLEAEIAQVVSPVRGVPTSFPLADFATYLAVLWAAGLLTATFSAVNERELRRRRYDVEVLRRFALQLEETDDTAKILLDLAKLSRDELLATRVVGVVRSVHEDGAGPSPEEGGTVVVLGQSDRPALGRAPTEFMPGSLVRRAQARRSTVLAAKPDPVADAWLLEYLPGAQNLVVVPFALERQLSGALIFEHGKRTSSRSMRVDRRILGTAEQATAHAAMALGRAALLGRLRGLAETDGLTRVANRRIFDDTLEREMARSDSTGVSFAVALVDLDHFKALNDQHGHLTGDDVLRGVARAIRNTCRDGDLAARYGGEEFAAVLVNITPEEAAEVAERIRMAIEAADVPVPITASVGVACYPDHAHDARSLVAASDAALYVAKSSGRNQVVTTGLAAAAPVAPIAY